MTPKEKAKELFFMYSQEVRGILFRKSRIKQCAFIAVDEIIQAIDFDWMELQNLDRVHAYWQQVKQEIEKL